MKKTLMALVVSAFMTVPAVANAEWFVQGNAGLGVQPTRSDDRPNTPAFSLGGGYDFGAVSAELEVVTLPQSNLTNSITGNVNGNLVSVNFSAQPFTFRNFTPFATAGVGYGWFDGNGVLSGKTAVPVVNIGLGTEYTISNNWGLVGSYRYFTSLEENIQADNGRTEAWSNHVFMAGVKYKF